MAIAGVLIIGSLVTIAAVAMTSGHEYEAVPLSPLARAQRLLDEGKVTEARVIYQDELKRDQNSLVALKGLSICARDSGDDEECVQHLQRLAMVSPKDLWTHRQLALALHRLSRDQEALAELQAAMALAKDDSSMSQLMSKIVMSQAKIDDPMSRIQNPMNQGKQKPFDPFSGIPRPPQTPNPTQRFPKPNR